MIFSRRPLPKSSDRRAWLRSYNYYQAQLMEGPLGAEALALCQPLIDRAGGWTYLPPEANPAPPAPESAEEDVAEKIGPPLDSNPRETEQSRLGTPAGIYLRNAVAWEGAGFPDPAKLSEEPRYVLRYYAAEAMDGEDADLLIPEVEDNQRWTTKIGAHRYGIVALKGYDVLRGLRQASILSFLEALEAPIIWQIGADAVIARALKTKLPNATIMMSCEPWEMVTTLASLRHTIPDARILVTDDIARVAEAWASEDFILVPTSKVAGLSPPRIDLAIDVMGLQQLGAEMVATLIGRAFEWGSPYFFSYALRGEPEEWPFIDPAPQSEHYFWMHDMPVRPTIDWMMAGLMNVGLVGRGLARRPELIKLWPVELRFAMGWRRLTI